MNNTENTLKPTYIIATLISVPFLANLLSVIFEMSFISPIMNIAKPEQLEIQMKISELISNNKIFAILLWVIPFGVPIVGVVKYIEPLFKILKYKGNPQSIDNTAQRRFLNSPIMISLIGISGWIINFIMVETIFYISSNKFLDLKFTMEFFIRSLATGCLCFVISYYLLEMISRKYFISYFFPDGNLSKCNGVIHLPIITKFYIFFFAVSLYPLFLISAILFNMEGDSEILKIISNIIQLILVLSVIGAILTYLISKTYQNPLVEMKNATDDIRSGNYDVKVEVTSTDEIGNLGEGINEMSAGLKEKEFIKDTFGKVVDPVVRDHLLKGNVNLGGELRNATILFSDIRGFTTLSESLSPDKIVILLNKYFDRMSICISEQNGLVNKYIGDGMLAVFGVPIKLNNTADAGINSAIKMIQAKDLLNNELKKENLPVINIGIGIHTGEVLAGNIGSKSRIEYTVIGDAVNLASRIEGLTKYYNASIIISERTLGNLENPTSYNYRFLGKIKVKGKREPVSVFEILDGLSEEIKSAKIKTKDDFERGIYLYYDRKFKESLQLFDKVLNLYKDDKAVEIYIKNCEYLIKNEVSENWDGTELY